MKEKEMLSAIYNAIDDKKGENIRILDISDLTVIADYFVIATGGNQNQVQAITDSVGETLLKNYQITPKQTEGYKYAGWILMDYGQIVVHIFGKEERAFYDLDRIWCDAKEVSL